MIDYLGFVYIYFTESVISQFKEGAIRNHLQDQIMVKEGLAAEIGMQKHPSTAFIWDDRYGRILYLQ